VFPIFFCFIGNKLKAKLFKTRHVILPGKAVRKALASKEISLHTT